MGSVKMGIIGAGGMAGQHAKLYGQNARSEVVCICDLVEEKARQKAEELGCDCTTDYKELLKRKDIDAVLVAIPNSLHYQVALESLRAGKHTAVEYPITQTAEEYDALCREASKGDLVLHDALTPIIEPQPLAVKKLISKIGKVFAMQSAYYASAGGWYVDTALRGNFFSSLTIHMIVYFNFVLDQSPDWVNASLHFSETEQGNNHVGIYLCHYPDGTCAYSEWGMGFAGRLRWDWLIQGQDGKIIYESPPGSAHRARMISATGEEEVVEIDAQNVAHSQEVDNFLAQILDGADSYVSQEQSRNAIRICQAAQESAQTGQRVCLS